MSLHRFRRSSAPLSILTFVVFVAGMFPARVARADDPPASGAVGTGGAPSFATAPPPATSGAALATVNLSRGTAQSSVPFQLMTARGQAQPSLSLNYDSSAGVGFGGIGWSLNLPSIERRGASGLPRFVDGNYKDSLADRFVFGGKPIVPVCVVGSGGACAAASFETIPARFAGWTYFRAELDDGVRLFFSANGATWVAQTKAGIEMQFGAPLDGLATTAIDTAGSTLPMPGATDLNYRWNLVRQLDQSANTVYYVWQPGPSGTLGLLTDIYDTPPKSSGFNTTVFAHHTHLVWSAPDQAATLAAQSPPWRMPTDVQLLGVDVTSSPWLGGTRQLVRRYHLAYVWNANGTQPQLQSVTMEGECGNIAEGTNGQLADVTGCPTLPPTTFTYTSQVASLSPLAPYVTGGVFPTPTGSTYTLAVADINGDAIADGLTLNQGVNSYAALGNTVSLPTQTSRAATLADLFPGKINTVLGDWIGDGKVDLLWMNFGANTNASSSNASGYELYSFLQSQSSLSLVGLGPTVPPIPWTRQIDGYESQITFQSGKALDIDGDGLTDMTYVNGNASAAGSPNTAQTYLTARDSFGNIQPFRQLTTSACLATSDFNNGTTIASVDGDMDGDGLPDLTYITFVPNPPGPSTFGNYLTISVYQNRGDGRFGSPTFYDGTSPGACYLGSGAPYGVQNPFNATTLSFSNINIPDLAQVVQNNLAAVHDVDGDGFADLVLVAADGVHVALHSRNRVPLDPNDPGLGIDDFSLMQPLFAQGWWTIKSDGDYANLKLFFGDLNGAGIDSILVNDTIPTPFPNGSTEIDSFGTNIATVVSSRPGLLSTISNGFGATTEITYDTLNDVVQTGRIPTPVQVVTKVTTTNGIVASIASQTYEDDYEYESPVYDARDREFIGFQKVTDHRVGDATAPGTATTTTFLTATCPVSPGNGCTPGTDYWYHMERELPAAIEVEDQTEATHLTTTVNQYLYLDLFTGLDNRIVRTEWIGTVDLYLFDPSQQSGSAMTFNAISPDSSNEDWVIGEKLSVTIPKVNVDLRRASTRDHFGNEATATDYGNVANDLAIVSTRNWQLPAGDPTGWNFRLFNESIAYQGSAVPSYLATPRATTYGYESRGLLQTVSSPLSGTLPLVRSNPGGMVAGTPVGASQDSSSITLSTRYYDPYGNLIEIQEPNNRCSTIAYDTQFNQLPASRAAYRGGCGVAPLTTTQIYDRGHERVTTVTTPSDQMTVYKYDGFGRLYEVDQPSSEYPGQVAPSATVVIDYSLADTNPSPVRKIHVQKVDGSASVGFFHHDGWTYLDAFGAPLAAATPNDDGSALIITGMSKRTADGHVATAWDAFSYASTDGSTFDPTTSPPPGTAYETFAYEGLGRPSYVTGFSTDSTTAVTQKISYNAPQLAVTVQNSDQFSPMGPHHNASTIFTSDGHGRSKSTTQHLPNNSPAIDVTTTTQYLATGEPAVVTQSSGSNSTVRWMQYDSLGRMVLNAEPNTAKNMTAPGVVSSSLAAWRYAYNNNGDLVGTSDARGCGENITYDNLGRIRTEDYSPCTSTQLPYSSPQANMTGYESVYDYDTAAVTTPWPISYAGSLTEVYDRAEHARFVLDPRGRTTQVQRQIAVPFADSVTPASRYAPHWFVKNVLAYDEQNRVTETDTGLDAADAPQLNTSRGSYVNTEYTARGAVLNVTSPYGLLLASQNLAPNGRVNQVVYGDVASTTATYGYYPNGRLNTYSLRRGAGPWLATGGNYSPPSQSSPNTLQGDLTDLTFTYDGAGNPTEIDDASSAAWPAGAKPQATKAMVYDDAYRLLSTTIGYTGGTDPFTSPYAAEAATGTGKYPTLNANCNGPSCPRVTNQSFTYDWQGNMVTSSDDKNVFPDRSLGTITNGAPGAVGPHQLATATGNGGGLAASYDAAGNLTTIQVTSTGTAGVAPMTYGYQWDELGRLAQATRIEHAGGRYQFDATMKFTYDSSNQRVLQSLVDPASGDTLYDVDVFDSMHLTHATFPDANGDYERDATTESLYLASNGTTYAHVLYTQEDEPAASAGALHTYMLFGDSLGSTSFVIDHDTGELVERPTFQSYGAPESDFRPDRWGDYRERYRYTGQDDDAEVGLVYFGQRYYSSVMGRWLSPDPLTIHGLGSTFNPYQFVSSSPTALTDANGLCGGPEEDPCPAPDASAQFLGIGPLVSWINQEVSHNQISLPTWYFANHHEASGPPNRGNSPVVQAAPTTPAATPRSGGVGGAIAGALDLALPRFSIIAGTLNPILIPSMLIASVLRPSQWIASYRGTPEFTLGAIGFGVASVVATPGAGAERGAEEIGLSMVSKLDLGASDVFSGALGFVSRTEAAAGEAAPNIVYRGLAAGEDPAAGLVARAPDAANSVASHVAGARASQWISTTRSLDVAAGRFGANGVVAIDLSKVGSQVVDLTGGIPGIGPNTMLSRWAINAQEVLIQGSIPAEAITPLP